MNSSYYKPSGKSTLEFFLLFLLFMGISLPVISNIYIYLVHFIPFVYINVVLTAGCGLLAGFLIDRAVVLGKARSPLMVLALTLAAVCVMKYIQWCVYIPLVVSRVYGFPMTLGERFAESLFYFKRPGDVIVAMRIINEFGVWGFSKARIVTGTPLGVVWVLEFLIMAGAAALMTWVQPGRPYSEEAGAWYAEMTDKATTNLPEDVRLLIGKLEGGMYADFRELARVGAESRQEYLSVTFYQPPEGSLTEPHYMAIDQCEDRKGRIRIKPLARYLAVDGQSVRDIINSGAFGAGVEPGEEPDAGRDEAGAEPDAAAPLLDMDV